MSSSRPPPRCLVAEILHDLSDVHEWMREAILTGQLQPGVVLSQGDIADELGVTRTPVREALRMLQAEGLIQAESNRRATVTAMTASDLEQLWVLRITLEAEALRLSMPHMAPEDLAQLEGFAAEMDYFADAGNSTSWRRPHRAFHFALTVRAGKRIARTLTQWFDHAERYERLCLDQEVGQSADVGHREIVDACKLGARDRGAAGLASHLAYTGFQILERLDRDHEPIALCAALSDAGGKGVRTARLAERGRQATRAEGTSGASDSHRSRSARRSGTRGAP
jgi:DNA-binding GntR family transcriptional regulator